MKEVSYVILTRDRPDSLTKVLARLERQLRESDEVIVVDNASTPAVVLGPSCGRASVRVVRSDSNRGIAGWNLGFAVARHEAIMVLDDDCAPVDGAVAHMCRLMDGDPSIGVVAPLVVHPSTGAYENEARRLHLRDGMPDDILFIGCGALLRKSVVDSVGGFSEDIFLYWHEMEFSLRLLGAGFRTIFCPEAKVEHWQDAGGRTSARKTYYETRNLLLIVRSYLPGGTALRVGGRHALHLGRRAVRDGAVLPWVRGAWSGVFGHRLACSSPLKPQDAEFVLARWYL